MIILLKFWGYWTTGAAPEVGTGGRIVHPAIIINPSEVT